MNEEIKRLTKVEKLQKDLFHYENDLKKTRKTLEENSKLSDEDIWNLPENAESRESCSVTWETIISRGADKNYNFSEELFNEKQLEYKNRKIAFFKSMKIESEKRRIPSLEKEIKKLNDKINALLN